MSVLGANPMMMKPAAAAAAAGDVVTKSLRFNDGDTPYLQRTTGTSSDQTKCTHSFWMKRSTLGANQRIFEGGSNAGFLMNGYSSSDEFRVNNNGALAENTTTQLLRDTSAFYHICVSIDSALSSADQLKLYINGTRVTSFSRTDSIETNQALNPSGTYATIGKAYGGGEHFDGYLADYYMLDGVAAAATDFAEEDATTGQWKPKAYSGTYGTNGFHLDSEEDSATSGSNAGIGKDVSGNGNYFDTTNLAASDVVNDTPTDNYCVWNPLNTHAPITLSEGNLSSTYSGGAYQTATAGTIAVSSGKWYWEVTVTTVGASFIGLALASVRILGTEGTNNTFSSGDCWTYDFTGDKNNWPNDGVVYGDSYTSGEVIGVAFDADNGTLTFYNEGVTQGTAYTGLTSGPYMPIDFLYSGAVHATNFGQSDFAQTPPTGFSALSTGNLPTPTIAKPSEHFNALTYAGSGAKTGVGFQPDLVWVKARGNTYDHELTDSVRGVEKALSSNDSGVESTDSTGLTVFGTDGFTVGAGLNYATTSMVAWNWLAEDGFEAVSGVSDSGSKNVDAGFSIVTWTGNDSTGSAAPQAVSHGLTVAPELIIAKKRTSNGMGNGSWVVWTKDLTSGTYLIMDGTPAAEASWTDALVSGITSSSVSFGSDLSGNSESLNDNTGFGGADTYVGYLFATVAGHSKVGLYNGNSSDNFVSLDFAPAWILIKSTGNPSSSGHWIIKDNKRSAAYNPADGNLYANDTYAEDTTASVDIDLLSNGFNIQGTYAGINATSSSYIFLAMAEKPLKYASAR